MALPQPMRPADPRAMPPRRRAGKRWIWVMLVTLVGIGLPAAIIFVRSRPDRSHGAEIAADQFMDAIVAGSSQAAGQGGKTGYQFAYDMLSEKMRASMPFDVFFENWSRLFDQRGYVVDRIRVVDRDAADEPRRWMTTSYLLFLGGEQQDYAKLNTVQIELKLRRQRMDYFIENYSLRDVPNPRATR
jgi:hypothetical protein